LNSFSAQTIKLSRFLNEGIELVSILFSALIMALSSDE
jgi:hypothetical protein